MEHRSDIDSLSAVAILPLLAFHAGVQKLSGGFIGVDVFFVISGFLIGTMILTELDQGRFSIANFYSRRFRRILPALTAVLLAAAIVGAFILYPVRLVEFGRSIVAAALSVSNIYFQLTSDYFDSPSAIKPLLHLVAIRGRAVLPGATTAADPHAEILPAPPEAGDYCLGRPLVRGERHRRL